MRKMMGRKGRILALVAMTLSVVGTYGVYATHQFPDVPTGSFYHNAVEWIVNRGITGGCAGGTNYCPGSNVTRAEMAVFLRATGEALTPQYLNQQGSLGATDLDAGTVLCQTAAFTPTFPRTARVDTWVSFLSTAGAFNFTVQGVFSTNGGATWSSVDGVAFSRDGASAANVWAAANNNGVVSLTPGTAYLFGARVGRAEVSGLSDPTDGRCETLVTLTNRSTTASPFIVQQPAAAEPAPGTAEAAQQ
jgi:hypothetical protein